MKLHIPAYARYLAYINLLIFSVSAAIGDSVTVTKDGKPEAQIVIADASNQSSLAYQAADILRHYIEKMSGATLSIKGESEMGKVTVKDGRINEGLAINEAVPGTENVPGETLETTKKEPLNFILVGESALTRQLGVTSDGLKPGGIRVITKPNAIVLLGGPETFKGELGSDASGIQNAAIELLEHLGCSYLWRGRLGMVIPRKTTIHVDALDLTYNPSIRARGIRVIPVLGSERPDSGLKRLGMSKEEYDQGDAKAAKGNEADASWEKLPWEKWQRLGGTMQSFGHAGAGLRNADKYFSEHPEWFALQADGTRDQLGDDRFELCFSNQELIKHVADDIIKQLNENPNLGIVSLDLNDGSSINGSCLCKACLALDPPDAPPVKLLTYPTHDRKTRAPIDHVSLSDRLVSYWNAVADRVRAVHPNVIFGISAYSSWSEPPVKNKLQPGFVLRYVPEEAAGALGWKAAGAERIFWRPNVLLYNRRTGKLGTIVDSLGRSMKDFEKAGIVQTDFDAVMHNWASIGLSYFAAARLIWNPHLSSQEIIRDYANRGFGAAAPSIVSYFNRIEKITEQSWGVRSEALEPGDLFFSPAVISELRGFLNSGEAAAEAAKDPDVVERIAFLRLALNFTELQETLELMARRAEKNLPNDPAQVKKLVDLNCLVLRDIVTNHNFAMNVPYTIYGSNTFARLAPIQGATVTPSDPALLARLGNPKYGWTGHEDNLQDMLRAFGL